MCNGATSVFSHLGEINFLRRKKKLNFLARFNCRRQFLIETDLTSLNGTRLIARVRSHAAPPIHVRKKGRLANAERIFPAPISAGEMGLSFRRSISQFRDRTPSCVRRHSLHLDKALVSTSFRVYGRAVTIDIRAPYARQPAQGQGPRRYLQYDV